MFCRTCGNNINDRAVICPHCGCETGNPMQSVQPVVQYVPVEQPKKKENTMAIVALIVSLVGAWAIPLAGSIAGLILGILGFKQSKKMNGEGKGMSIASIVVSAVTLAGYVILILIYVFYFIFLFWAMFASTPVYY